MNDIDKKMELFRETYVRRAGDAAGYADENEERAGVRRDGAQGNGVQGDGVQANSAQGNGTRESGALSGEGGSRPVFSERSGGEALRSEGGEAEDMTAAMASTVKPTMTPDMTPTVKQDITPAMTPAMTASMTPAMASDSGSAFSETVPAPERTEMFHETAESAANAENVPAAAAAMGDSAGNPGVLSEVRLQRESSDRPEAADSPSISDFSALSGSPEIFEPIFEPVKAGRAGETEGIEEREGTEKAGGSEQEKEVFQPQREMPPDFALMPASSQNPAKLIPADEDLKSSRLRITGMYRRELPVMTIEEDVLVPDVEPDLEQIINIDARPEITSHELYQAQNGQDMYRIGGTISLSTLYVPVADDCELISIGSKISFRRECEAEEQNEDDPKGLRGGDASEPKFSVILISVSAKVINERKIRVRAEIRCTVKKYIEEETEFLEGVRDGELNLKKETIRFTDIAQRRTDTTDVSGEVIFKDNMPELEKILSYDVNVVELRRQIGKGKAVIDACAYYSILYMPKAGSTLAEGEAEGCADSSEIPVFYRGKLEFTQFIKLPDTSGANASDSQISFDVISSKLGFETPEDGDGKQRLMLSITVAAGIDIFRDMEREIVTDMYHRARDVDFSTVPRRVSELCGSGATEVSVREIISLPESKKGFGRIPYISASVEGIEATAENGKCRIEGFIETNTVYEAEEGEVGFASFAEKLPFRTTIDIPDVREGMMIDCTCGMKDIWFDRMNARQVEFNCTLAVSVYAWKVQQYDFIDKVCYIERGDLQEDGAGMVVYVTRPGDTQWSIAKEFRTTTRELQMINGLEESDYVESGRKLLIL